MMVLNLKKFVLLFIAYIAITPVIIFADTPVKSSDENKSTGSNKEEQKSPHWIDIGQSFTASSVDNLSKWIDGFFGAPRSNVEAARSSLRLILLNEWEEGAGNDADVRLRGKVHLPRISRRLSLIFRDDEDQEGQTDSEISSVVADDQHTKVDLQYNIRDKKRSRLDFNLGVRSSLKGKASIRYRYTVNMGDSFRHRFTESLNFVDSEGFNLRSRYELDHIIDANNLLRWANNLKISEDRHGLDWSSRVSFAKRLDERSAISYFLWAGGRSDPHLYTSGYGFGIRFRNQFFRPWLFYELEPGYVWQREESTEPRDPLQGSTLLNFRLIMLLEKL